MTDIDWSTAPEWATHYGETGGGKYFYRIPGKLGGQYDYLNLASLSNSWGKGSGSPCAEMLIPRPAQSWSGEGLPPVGTVCEMHHDCWLPDNWPKVTVKYASSEYFITEDCGGEQHWHAHAVKFRPARTPEQIAKDERDKAIDEIMDDLSLSPECRYIASRVYEAGYRKP